MSKKPYKTDPRNARAHPERNQAMIRQSLEEIGGGRSILVGGEGYVIAGNGVYEQAQKLGLTIREVEARPDELIAVKRADLVGERAVRAAILDNATGETSEWEWEQLRQLQVEYPDVLSGMDELEQRFAEQVQAMNAAVPDVDFKEYDESAADDVKYCECPNCGHKFPA